MASRLFSGILRRRLFSTAVSTTIILPTYHPSVPMFFNSQSLIPNISPKPFPFSLRFLSTRSIRSTRGKKPDIGARARQIQSRRLWTYALTFSAIAGFIIIVLYQFQDQLVFYVTPTEALEKYTANPSKTRFRLGGLVLENSIAEIPSSVETQFVVTDLLTDILVKYEGSLPDLFREGHSVVVEGFVRPVDEEIKKQEESILKRNKLDAMEKARSLGCYFYATEVLAKHDEKYMPAEVAAAIEKNKKIIAEEEKKKGEEASISGSKA